jgi:hypothetical protein
LAWASTRCPVTTGRKVEVEIQRKLDAVEVQHTSEANAFVQRLATENNLADG